MKSSLLLSAAFALLVSSLSFDVQAQVGGGGVDDRKPNTRAARKAEAAKKSAATNAAPEYPAATRTFPEQKPSKGLEKQIQALFKIQEDDTKLDEQISIADAILANGSATPYDKSAAAYIAGRAWQGKETSDYANATKYYQLAIDNNGLHNNMHYRGLLQLAQMYNADEKYDQALGAINKFIDETKSDDAQAWTIKAQILGSLKRPQEAIQAIEKLLAGKPNDKKLMMALASAYMESEQDAKAGQVFDKMRAAGLLTEDRDYDAGWRLLANIEGRQKDALALLEEGLSKGVLKPTAEVYGMKGQAAWDADDIKGAIDAWGKGAPLSKTGDMYLNLAQANLELDRYADAKAAANAGKEKGVKRMGVYWQSIARAENGLGNAAATKAALTEAAKYPETKKWAEAGLRQGLAK